MQNWHTINAQRRRYINYSTTLLNGVLRDIRLNYSKSIIEIGDAETALNTISSANIERDVRAAFNDIYTITGVAFAKSAVATLQKSHRMKLKADPRILESQWVEFMLDFVAKKCGTKITSITRNIFADIESITKSVVRQTVETGWGPARVADEIFRQVGQRDKWRAMRIARTEVVGASNTGSYRGAGSFGVKLRKIWLVNIDANTRDDHAAMQGAGHIAYDERWQVGNDMMLHPHDPDASAENVINCRCGITYEPEENIVDDLLSGRFNPESIEMY